MINFRDLIIQKQTLGEFFEFAYLYNLERVKFDRFINSDIQRSNQHFFEYMEGLSKFGKMTIFSQLDISIYKIRLKDGHVDRSKYHAIDKSGLSIGFIYGPHDAEGPKNIYSNADQYFGTRLLDKGNHFYECVILMNSIKSGYKDAVNLEELRAKYLPLPKKSNGFDLYVYCYTSNEWDAVAFGNVIYRSKERSFLFTFGTFADRTP